MRCLTVSLLATGMAVLASGVAHAHREATTDRLSGLLSYTGLDHVIAGTPAWIPAACIGVLGGGTVAILIAVRRLRRASA